MDVSCKASVNFQHMSQTQQLDAALTMRFTKTKRQHDTTKVLRLPLKMTMKVFKVLPLPRKAQNVF